MKDTKKIIALLTAIMIAAAGAFTAMAADEETDSTTPAAAEDTVDTTDAADKQGTESTKDDADSTDKEDADADNADKEDADADVDSADNADADADADSADNADADTDADSADNADADTDADDTDNTVDYSQFDGEGVEVVLDNKKIEFDVQPEIIEGRTMVPVRAIFEALGATVAWENETQTITAVKDSTVVMMQIDNTSMFVDGTAKELDVAPLLKDDSRTLVPLRAISEAFGCKVDFIDETETVVIISAADDTKNTDDTKDGTDADSADKTDEDTAADDTTKADDTTTTDNTEDDNTQADDAE